MSEVLSVVELYKVSRASPRGQFRAPTRDGDFHRPGFLQFPTTFSFLMTGKLIAGEPITGPFSLLAMALQTILLFLDLLSVRQRA